MKIAIIGSGISGNTIAHLLHNEHDIKVFESNSRIGGHSHTHNIKMEKKEISVDTGFIVFNKKTYPLFTELLNTLGVKYENSSMSFSVFSDISGLEYNGTNVNTLFAQRKNIFNLKFIKMIWEIIRFNKKSIKLLSTESNITLGDYLKEEKYSTYFTNNYILPMGSAIWSSDIKTMESFPAKFFISFFYNHGMLSINERPQWLTITGGSQHYVKKLCASFEDKIETSSEIQSVERCEKDIKITLSGKVERFDYVFFACHSDEALMLLKDPSDEEKKILSSIPYTKNEVFLHTDISMMPKNKLAWAAWNYSIDNQTSDPVTLTYNMNILQNIDTRDPLLVTLNPNKTIDKNKIIKKLTYTHPKFSLNSILAQKKHSSICGQNRTGYAGAYWGNGFHEDGVKSAYKAVKHFEDWQGK